MLQSYHYYLLVVRKLLSKSIIAYVSHLDLCAFVDAFRKAHLLDHLLLLA